MFTFTSANVKLWEQAVLAQAEQQEAWSNENTMFVAAMQYEVLSQGKPVRSERIGQYVGKSGQYVFKPDDMQYAV